MQNRLTILLPAYSTETEANFRIQGSLGQCIRRPMHHARVGRWASPTCVSCHCGVIASWLGRGTKKPGVSTPGFRAKSRILRVVTEMNPLRPIGGTIGRSGVVITCNSASGCNGAFHSGQRYMYRGRLGDKAQTGQISHLRQVDSCPCRYLGCVKGGRPGMLEPRIPRLQARCRLPETSGSGDLTLKN